MSKNLKTQWRVEWRKSRAHAWRKGGLFETRRAARETARSIRAVYAGGGYMIGVGFGNTRVIKYVKGQK